MTTDFDFLPVSWEDVDVPWDAYGNLLRKPWVPEGEVIWKKAKPFFATLRIAEFVRGRQAPYVTWLDENDRFYPMHLWDLVETLRTVPSEIGGRVTAEWIPHQRGTKYVTYGLRLNLSQAERRIARLGHP